jgi:hypothetical protein
MKRLKSCNSNKNHQIKIVVQYEQQQHIMTNHPNKYESYRTNNLRDVAFTKWSGTDRWTDKPKNYMPPYYPMQGIIKLHLTDWIWCNLNSPSYELSLDLGILFLCLQGFNIGSINAVFTLSVTWEHSFECPQNFLLRQTVINKTKADNVRQICHVKFTNQP